MKIEEIFSIICGIAILVMVVYYIRRKRKVRSLLFGALTGAAALILVNKYGDLIGTDIPLSVFNITGSCILGVPFVVILVVINFL